MGVENWTDWLPEEALQELSESWQLAREGKACVPPAKVIAEFVDTQRAVLGCTQQMLAALAGVSLSTIQRIERAERVSPETLERVGAVLCQEPGAFTRPRVPLTPEQMVQALEEGIASFEDRIPIPVKRLQTQPQVAKLVQSHLFFVDVDRLGADFEPDREALGELLSFVSFAVGGEADSCSIYAPRRQRAKRRQLYTQVLDYIRSLERRGHAVALSGCYQAETGDALLPQVQVGVIGFFPRATDPGAVKRPMLFVPKCVELCSVLSSYRAPTRAATPG